MVWWTIIYVGRPFVYGMHGHKYACIVTYVTVHMPGDMQTGVHVHLTHPDTMADNKTALRTVRL